MKAISQKQKNHLENIRVLKSETKKETLKKAYNELIQQKETLTRYKLHKQTKIAYSTINKYYDEVVK
jgi:Fic family protein